MDSLIQPVARTWVNTGLVPKIHISSSKSQKQFRNHADNVNPQDLLPYFKIYRELDQDLDVMVEAKNKDQALFQLVKDLALNEGFKILDGGTLIYRP